MRIFSTIVGLLWIFVRIGIFVSPLVWAYFNVLKVGKFDEFRIETISILVWMAISLPVLFWREIAASSTSVSSIEPGRFQYQIEEDGDRVEEDAKKKSDYYYALATPGTLEYIASHPEE